MSLLVRILLFTFFIDMLVIDKRSTKIDFRHAYNVLLQGATEAGFSLRAAARHHTTDEPPSHEARAQSVLQDSIIRAMDIVLPHHSQANRGERLRPMHHALRESEGSLRNTQGSSRVIASGSGSVSIDQAGPSGGSSTNGRRSNQPGGRHQQQHHPTLPRGAQLPPAAASASRPPSSSSSLHPRMRRPGRDGELNGATA